jgi:predicted RNA-binding Zn-ribbon protein involved in translation (DUF1610 family)
MDRSTIMAEMTCSQCAATMTELESGDDRLYVCPECAGQWVEGAQLNALLLHANLPGVDSQGGRVMPDAETGTCGTCNVDLMRIEQARKGPLAYEACADCGFIFVPFEPGSAADFEAAHLRLMGFFKKFAAR